MIQVGDMGSPVKSWNTYLIAGCSTLATPSCLLYILKDTISAPEDVQALRIHPDVLHCDENRKGSVDINDFASALHYNLQSKYASKINKNTVVAEEDKKMLQLK
jgi:hypothetical protein